MNPFILAVAALFGFITEPPAFAQSEEVLVIRFASKYGEATNLVVTRVAPAEVGKETSFRMAYGGSTPIVQDLSDSEMKDLVARSRNDVRDVSAHLSADERCGAGYFLFRDAWGKDSQDGRICRGTGESRRAGEAAALRIMSRFQSKLNFRGAGK